MALVIKTSGGWSKRSRCKAPEMARVASRRIRSDFMPRRRVGEPATRRTQRYAATTRHEGNTADGPFSPSSQQMHMEVEYNLAPAPFDVKEQLVS
jgi:hypothetical protein